MTAPLLRLAGVSIVRGSHRLLDDVSLAVAEGQHTAILGPNGSGKTTLLQLLARELYPSWVDGTQGRVELLGRTDWNVRELRRRIGLVGAAVDRAFAAGRAGRMSVRDAVATGFTAAELAEFGPERTPDIEASIDEAIDALDVTALAGRTLETLSTGERRRVLIARALVHRPDLLVLDEPTAGLDIAARGRLLDTLQSRLPAMRTTLVLVTHHMEEVIPAIDRCVLLSRGRVAFDGSADDALTSRRLSDLFGVSVRSPRDPVQSPRDVDDPLVRGSSGGTTRSRQPAT